MTEAAAGARGRVPAWGLVVLAMGLLALAPVPAPAALGNAESAAT